MSEIKDDMRPPLVVVLCRRHLSSSVVDPPCQVVPSKVISPMHAYCKTDVPPQDYGITLWHSLPVSVLDWQAEHAFAGVSGPIMKKLVEVKGFDEPDAEDMNDDEDIASAITLMEALGDFSEVELKAED